jgi:hypothetical protein
LVMWMRGHVCVRDRRAPQPGPSLTGPACSATSGIAGGELAPMSKDICVSESPSIKRTGCPSAGANVPARAAGTLASTGISGDSKKALIFSSDQPKASLGGFTSSQKYSSCSSAISFFCRLRICAAVSLMTGRKCGQPDEIYQWRSARTCASSRVCSVRYRWPRCCG